MPVNRPASKVKPDWTALGRASGTHDLGQTVDSFGEALDIIGVSYDGANFLSGAHALRQADALLTRDQGFYRRYFAELKVTDPARG